MTGLLPRQQPPRPVEDHDLQPHPAAKRLLGRPQSRRGDSGRQIDAGMIETGSSFGFTAKTFQVGFARPLTKADDF